MTSRTTDDSDETLDVRWTVEPAGEGRPQMKQSEGRLEPQQPPQSQHPAAESRTSQQPAFDPSFAEIFVNIGRQDGVSASDFQRVLTDVAEISRAETGKIRVRDRSSFVSVKRELLEKAVAALNGATFSGKVAQAQPARARSTGTSSPNDG